MMSSRWSLTNTTSNTSACIHPKTNALKTFNIFHREDYIALNSPWLFILSIATEPRLAKPSQHKCHLGKRQPRNYWMGFFVITSLLRIACWLMRLNVKNFMTQLLFKDRLAYWRRLVRSIVPRSTRRREEWFDFQVWTSNKCTTTNRATVQSSYLDLDVER